MSSDWIQGVDFSLSGVFVAIVDILSTIPPFFALFALCLAFLLWFVWVKIRYPFWSTQPVRHTYDWIKKPGILHAILPKTKFYDPILVTTRFAELLSISEKEDLCRLLQSHWIPSDQLFCSIQAADFDVYLAGHCGKPVVSVLHERVYASTDATPHTNLLGMVCSTPVWFHRRDEAAVKIAFQDYLCLRRENASRIRTLFDTHEYNGRIMHPDIPVSVFKKEVERLEGVVPLVEYTCYTFYMRNRKLRHLPAHFQLVRVHHANVDLLHDFVRMIPAAGFDAAILPDIGAITARLESNQMYMYVLKRGEEVFGFYWFKNAYVNWDADELGATLHLVASYQNTENMDLFCLGFSHSLKGILRENRNYRMLMLDGLGSNGGIVDVWRKTHDVIVETPCAYYLYNWGMETVEKEKCLVMV